MFKQGSKDSHIGGEEWSGFYAPKGRTTRVNLRNTDGFEKARDLERESEVWRNLQPFCYIMLQLHD
jgi:hypothetical protein